MAKLPPVIREMSNHPLKSLFYPHLSRSLSSLYNYFDSLNPMFSNQWQKAESLPPEDDPKVEADTASAGILHTLVVKNADEILVVDYIRLVQKYPSFTLLKLAIWYWNAFLNKCGYVTHHCNAHFSLYIYFLANNVLLAVYFIMILD